VEINRGTSPDEIEPSIFDINSWQGQRRKMAEIKRRLSETDQDEVDARTIVFATLAEGWSSDLQRYAAKQGEQSLQTWNFLTCSDLL